MSWGPSGLNRQSVKVVAVDPQDARNIYAGTDEGIQKSFNGGATWAAIGPIDGSTGKAHLILDIAINVENPLIVYAVTWVGESRTSYYSNHYLVKSSDGGKSWQIKFTKKFGYSINSVLIDSDDPQRIYIGMDDLEGGVYVSINGGDTWTAKRLPDGTSSSQEVVALAMTPAGSIPPHVYAIIRDNGGYTSMDRRDTWTNTSAPDINGNGPWAVTIDPVDPSIVCVGTRS